ncbi:MAG: hypothetical protein ACQESE_01095 [Nanobdellota archaeon]
MKRDIVIARPGTEKEFVAEAKRLGWKELLILYEEKDAKTIMSGSDTSAAIEGVAVKSGVLLTSNKVPRWIERFEEVALLGTMFSQVPKGVTLLCDNEYEKEKDFTHQRRSGVSHVTLAACKEKGINLVVGISGLFSGYRVQGAACQRSVDSEQRSAKQRSGCHGFGFKRMVQVLGRIWQNQKMAVKKNVHYEIVSMARCPEEMRSRVDVDALKRVLE